MKIKKGDNVIVLTGKNQGAKGKVLKSLPTINKVVVEGVNIVKRHTKSRVRGQAGQVVERSLPIAVSNVAIFCAGCKKGSRVAMETKNDKKVRVCATCRKEI
jgi:large subunit ribosomal protein L24